MPAPDPIKTDKKIMYPWHTPSTIKVPVRGLPS